MLSEVCVILSRGGLPTRGVYLLRDGVCLLGVRLLETIQVVTSIGGHYSGGNTSYWNTFLLFDENRSIYGIFIM